jgi:hypothetical protein
MGMKKKTDEKYEDSYYEGRDKAFMDVDRMINEGMGGGDVQMRQNRTNIEEARELTEEEPPNEI